MGTKRKDLTVHERLTMAGGGAFAALYGYGQILRRKPIYSNWMGENIPALYPIFLGTLLIVIAIMPWGRITFLWEAGGKKRGH